jgi:ribonuclease HI
LDTRRRKKSVMEPSFRGARHFDELHVYVDGASRGNPGPAAIGVVILTRQGRKVASFGEAIGETTNNYAEYTALIHALRLLSIFEVDRLRIYTDSELMASQINGDYRVKEKTLKPLHAQIVSMLGRYREYEVRNIPREENAEADLLANRALNEQGRLGREAVKPARKVPEPPSGQSRLFEGDTENDKE